jgi:hypothetical protein
MTRLFIGLTAILIAAGTAAFTNAETAATPKKKAGTVLFHFIGSDATDQNQVKDKDMWAYGAASPSCSGTANKACQLEIDEAQTTTNPGEDPVLNNDILVTAGAGGATNGYVPSPSTPGYEDSVNRP